ncbi:MAG: sigma-70 family RNA polymerase sigma factor [Actinomycetota bacterium]
MGDRDVADDAAFERWYRREHPRVAAALAVAGGHVDVAREATDEAFVRAYERWPRVRVMDSPGGWLYRVALNELRRRLRRRTIERELLRRHRPPDRADDPPPVADPRVWDAVRQLPRRQRSAVALRYVLDLSERDVATTMGITRGAASATLASARHNLQQALGEPVDDGDLSLPVGSAASETDGPHRDDAGPVADLVVPTSERGTGRG